jgi:hypothetical protein
MTAHFKVLRKLLMIVIAIVALACASLLMYSEILSFSPRPLDTESDSLDVCGVYWKLPLASVDTLTLLTNRLTVKGKYLPFLGGSLGLRRITRTIPPGLDATKLYPDSGWTTWYGGDVIRHFIGRNVFWWSIMNLHTGQQFSYAIPFKASCQILRFYHGSGDTSVAIFGFGRTSQDEQSLMGYVLITNRVQQ